MKTISVELGKYAITDKSDTILKSNGIGSGLCIAVYESKKKIGGLAHIVLPDSHIAIENSMNCPAYFADTAVRFLLKQLNDFGLTNYDKLKVKLVGGSNILTDNKMFDLGSRNLLAVKKNLWLNHLYPSAEETGGIYKRNIWLEIDSGKIYIYSTNRGVLEI